MSKFVKRNTKKNVEILGNNFEVDLGRDGVIGIIEQLNEQIKKTEGKYQNEKNAVERRGKIEAEEKRLFKEAINALLDDSGASGRIFKEDNSAILHADVYTFLVNEYVKIGTNREQRRK